MGINLFPSNWEFATRFTQVNPDDVLISSVTKRTEYAIGLSKYIFGHSFKIQSDISYLNIPKNCGKDDLLYRLQIDLEI